MVLQRKNLTKEQKDAICKKYEHAPGKCTCEGCPLKKVHKEELFMYCYKYINELEEFINEYWNEEIKIKE